MCVNIEFFQDKLHTGVHDLCYVHQNIDFLVPQKIQVPQIISSDETRYIYSTVSIHQKWIWKSAKTQE